MATVPNNSLQQRLQQLTKQQQKPSFGVQKHIVGTILRVITSAPIPVALQMTMQKHPGKLYAEVRLNNGKQYFLAFADSVEMIYSVYGDANQLVGRDIIVTYYDHNIESGSIHIDSKLSLPIANIEDTIIVLDIGGIL